LNTPHPKGSLHGRLIPVQSDLTASWQIGRFPEMQNATDQS
jgi:hypothetical protein